MQWFQEAADNGSANAMYFLFQYYSHHAEQGKNPQFYLLKAAEAGHILAQLLIVSSGLTYDFSENVKSEMMDKLLKQDESAILKLDNTNVVKLIIIDIFLSTDNTNNQKKKGLRMLRQLAQENDPEALLELGMLYMNGHIVKLNPTEARKHSEQGAKLGDADCLCSLGYFWDSGLGGERDDQKAHDYFRRSAEQGNANSHNKLGIYYKNIKKDYSLAEYHFKQAMALDSPEKLHPRRVATFNHAVYNLAMLYLAQGKCLGKSEEDAISLFKQAAEADHREAILFLIRYYRDRGEYISAMKYIALIDPKAADKLTALMPEAPLKQTLTPSTLSSTGSISNQNVFSPTPQQKRETLKELENISHFLKTSLKWQLSKDGSRLGHTLAMK